MNKSAHESKKLDMCEIETVKSNTRQSDAQIVHTTLASD